MQDDLIEPSSTAPAKKFRKLLSHGSRTENNQASISDSDVNNIVGIGDSSELEVHLPIGVIFNYLGCHHLSNLRFNKL